MRTFARGSNISIKRRYHVSPEKDSRKAERLWLNFSWRNLVKRNKVKFSAKNRDKLKEPEASRFFSAVSEKIRTVYFCFRGLQPYSTLPEKISSESVLHRADFFALKTWCFSAVSEKKRMLSSSESVFFFRKNQCWFRGLKLCAFRHESRLFRNLQVMSSAASELKECWSTLIFPESDLIITERLWDLNTG